MTANPPTPPTASPIPPTASPIPPIVTELAAGGSITCVWSNDLGGRTYRIDHAAGGNGDQRDGDQRLEYVKWAPDHEEIDLAREAERMSWVSRWITVPAVLGHGRDSATSAWLHTRGIPAESAVAARWKADPPTAARAIGAGLRILHDTVPVAACPWSWRIADRAARITDPAARAALLAAAPPEDLVVCHGDACVPNTLIDSTGRYAGHVDLGELGVGDRWADLAVATYSLGWNYRPACEEELLEAYGIERDDDRIAFYRRLWDAV